VTFYFNLESLVLPDSHVHPSYTSSSRPIFGPSRFEFNGVSSSARGSVARTIEASRDNRRWNTDSDSIVSYYNEQGCTPFQSTMPEISTGCLLSAMFVDVIRASIHDRDTGLRPSHLASDSIIRYATENGRPCASGPRQDRTRDECVAFDQHTS